MGAASSPVWLIDRSGLRLENLSISFQRYLLRGRDRISDIPSSLGAVQPFAVGESRFLVPLHEGEAIWIGVERESSSPTIRGIGWYRGHSRDLSDGRSVALGKASGLPAAPLVMIAGVPIEKGMFAPFRLGAEDCFAIDLAADDPDGRWPSRLASVLLVDPGTFLEQTGRAAPDSADPADAYGGWRLP